MNHHAIQETINARVEKFFNKNKPKLNYSYLDIDEEEFDMDLYEYLVAHENDE